MHIVIYLEVKNKLIVISTVNETTTCALGWICGGSGWITIKFDLIELQWDNTYDRKTLYR